MAKYYLNFALKIQWLGETSIAYTPESFAEASILISYPEIVEMVQYFSQTFQKVGVVEAQAEVIKNEAKTSTASGNSSLTATLTKLDNKLSSVSDTAFICQQKSVNQESLLTLCACLTGYIQESAKVLTKENILSKEQDLIFSGLREAIELRNYLGRYTTNSKKIYQSGYFYFLAA